MKKLIISALLATTAFAASSALALDACKYNVGLGVSWGMQNKPSFLTANFSVPKADGTVDTLLNYNASSFGYQKGFPGVDLRLGYNVNSSIQLGLNASYINDMQLNASKYDATVGSSITMDESLIKVMARAHFYSPETSTGTALFMGPNAGWQSSSLTIALANTAAVDNLLVATTVTNRKNTFVFGFDLGLSQSVNNSGTSLELMATLMNVPKVTYAVGDFPTPAAKLTFVRNSDVQGSLALGLKQNF